MKKMLLLSSILIISATINAQLIDTGSDVGIGTSQPQDRLHIFKKGLTNGNIHDVLRIQANTNSKIQTGFGARINFSLGKYSNIATGTSSTLGSISVYDASDESSFGTMAFATKEKFDKDLTNKMWLDRFGNLGIGVNHPSGQLHVHSSNPGDNELKSIGVFSHYNLSSNYSSGVALEFARLCI
ncbi:MAG: hypothetical protein AAF600_19660 [Bacteroidota bacterium]